MFLKRTRAQKRAVYTFSSCFYSAWLAATATVDKLKMMHRRHQKQSVMNAEVLPTHREINWKRDRKAERARVAWLCLVISSVLKSCRGLKPIPIKWMQSFSALIDLLVKLADLLIYQWSEDALPKRSLRLPFNLKIYHSEAPGHPSMLFYDSEVPNAIIQAEQRFNPLNLQLKLRCITQNEAERKMDKIEARKDQKSERKWLIKAGKWCRGRINAQKRVLCVHTVRVLISKFPEYSGSIRLSYHRGDQEDAKWTARLWEVALTSHTHTHKLRSNSNTALSPTT